MRKLYRVHRACLLMSLWLAVPSVGGASTSQDSAGSATTEQAIHHHYQEFVDRAVLSGFPVSVELYDFVTWRPEDYHRLRLAEHTSQDSPWHLESICGAYQMNDSATFALCEIRWEVTTPEAREDQKRTEDILETNSLGELLDRAREFPDQNVLVPTSITTYKVVLEFAGEIRHHSASSQAIGFEGVAPMANIQDLVLDWQGSQDLGLFTAVPCCDPNSLLSNDFIDRKREREGLTPVTGGTNTIDSPLMLDTGKPGLLAGVAGKARFDVDGDGQAEEISWPNAADPDSFLALDRNFNGTLDNRYELFGPFTPQPEATTSEPSGYAALAVYDQVSAGGNGDGKISAADPIFPFLTLWVDTNLDGVSQSGELTALPETDVLEIGLTHSESLPPGKKDGTVQYVGTYQSTSGERATATIRRPFRRIVTEEDPK